MRECVPAELRSVPKRFHARPLRRAMWRCAGWSGPLCTPHRRLVSRSALHRNAGCLHNRRKPLQTAVRDTILFRDALVGLTPITCILEINPPPSRGFCARISLRPASGDLRALIGSSSLQTLTMFFCFFCRITRPTPAAFPAPHSALMAVAKSSFNHRDAGFTFTRVNHVRE